MTTLENIDKLIEVYKRPEKYPYKMRTSLCRAWVVLFGEVMPEMILQKLRGLARIHPEYTWKSYFFPFGAIAPRLEILKQYRKQLTDGITKH